MTNLQIKSESLAERCEICHQSDCFDAQTSYCSRCADLATKTTGIDIPRIAKAATLTDIELGAFTGLVIGTLMGVIGGAITFSIQGWIGGIIISVMSLAPIWMMHGLFIGLLVGKSVRVTNAADFNAVTKAIDINNISQIARAERRFYLSLNTVKFALVGLITSLPCWRLVGGTLSIKIVVWAICGLINGATIETLCRVRSDRRV